MAGYVPQDDDGFFDWQDNWLNYAEDNKVALQLSDEKTTALRANQATYVTARTNRKALETQLGAAFRAEEAAQEDLESVLREESQVIQKRRTTTNEQRAGLKLTILDKTPTRVTVPSTLPVLRVDTSVRLQHTVHFVDSATPNKKAKPAGVRGCQIFVKIGDAPTSVAEMQFLITDPKTPHQVTFQPADAGKTAHYWARWENSRGETGPWGTPVSATIVG